jgi:hypothetical protein
MHNTPTATLAKAAHEQAVAIVHDVICDVAAAVFNGNIVVYQNDLTIMIDGPDGPSSIAFAPGAEPGNIDVVITAANGATVRLRGTVA